MTIKPINMNEYRDTAANFAAHIKGDEARKLTAYARRENMCPEVFLRDVIAAGIKSYEVYGVI